MEAGGRNPGGGQGRDAPDDDDAGLVWRILDGDRRAFTAVVERYGGQLLRLAGVFLRDRAASEEVVQETWLAVPPGHPIRVVSGEPRSCPGGGTRNRPCMRPRAVGSRAARRRPGETVTGEPERGGVAPHPLVAARHLDAAELGVEHPDRREVEGVERADRLGGALLAGAAEDLLVQRQEVAGALEGGQPSLGLAPLSAVETPRAPRPHDRAGCLDVR